MMRGTACLRVPRADFLPRASVRRIRACGRAASARSRPSGFQEAAGRERPPMAVQRRSSKRPEWPVLIASPTP